MSAAASLVALDRRALWLRWVIASTLGLAAGQVLFAVLDATIGDMGELGDGIAHYVGLPLAGAAFGFAQWRVLRRFVERSAWGMVAAAIGLLVGYVLGFALAGPPIDFLLGYVFMGTAAAIPQWLALRRSVAPSGWWIPASAGAFIAGGIAAVGVAVAGLGDALGSGEVAFLILVIVLGLIVGLISSTITGWVLLRVLSQPSTTSTTL
jgi:hypothetical protein